ECCMGNGPRTWERRTAQLVQIPECTFGNHKSGTLGSPFKLQSKCHGERSPIVAAHAPRKPIGLRFVEIGDMYDSIVYEPSTHSARWIRFALDEIQPNRRINGGVTRRKVCNYV